MQVKINRFTVIMIAIYRGGCLSRPRLFLKRPHFAPQA